MVGAMKEISLPKILNQGSIPGCASFAVAGLSDYYIKLKGIDDSIDPIALFNACERGGNGTNITQTIEYGKAEGLPSVKGNRYFIREWRPVAQSISELERNLDQHGGLVCTYSLHDKDPFVKRLDENAVLSRPPMDLHALVITGYDRLTRMFKLANSWGEKFGKGGYFFIPYTLMRSEYLKQVFWFSLA